VQKSYGKVLASIFFDQDSILLIDYLPNGQTINDEYYSSLLVQLKDILKEKSRGKFTKEVLFLHDNAPAHRALAVQKKLAYMGFLCLDNALYSPDLAPSDYHLFPGLKKQLKGRKRMEHAANHPSSFRSDLKKKVELYLTTHIMHRGDIFFPSRTWASNLFMPKGKSLITGWFAGRT